MTPNDKIQDHFRLKPAQGKALKKLGLETIEDLLFHFPARYENESEFVVAKVVSQGTRKGWHKRVPIAEMQLEDQTGNKIKAIWFSQAYMAKKFPEGALVRLSGKSKDYKGTRSYTNPKIEFANEALFELPGNSGLPGNLTPVYPESRGVSSLWLTYAIQKVLRSGIVEQIEDPLPAQILSKYNLPAIATALVWIHSPKKEDDATAARKRFSFQEIFLIQLSRQISRNEYERAGAIPVKNGTKFAREFESTLPFKPTAGQTRIIETILADISRETPMMRLVEGDVGSGKTFVAAAAAYAAVENRAQVAYMAPTEILAKQHFESFIKFFEHLPIQIGLLTGSECRKFPSKIEASGHTHVSRAQMLKWIADGSMSMVIGTHAHVAASVRWKNLALTIIDEQHRFGTRQRAKFAKQEASRKPHLLSMSATPIPRTLALTIYGDLDLSILDETPPGRKPILTKIVDTSKRSEAYEAIRREIKAGRQAYVICPRIDAPDPTKELALDTKSVMEETEKLGNEIFPELVVAAIHGKMSAEEKDAIMNEFARNEIQILVATSVIEVGVNVPNATIILIEGAERFGLAQLHQLRGRVQRSSHQAYCYLATSKNNKDVPARLKAIERAKNGFELAEEDLKLRGPGSLVGIKQSGISDIGMEALKNIKLVEFARTEASTILDRDPKLQDHPALLERVALTDHHFE